MRLVAMLVFCAATLAVFAATRRQQPRSERDAPRYDVDVAELGRRHLDVPVRGIVRAQLTPTFTQSRGDHPHEALDILAPRGAAVVAADEGTIVKLFTSKPGGLTIYQFDPSQRYAYYYAHLDRYAEGIREGLAVRRGDLLGFVGTTGNANPAQPHLHFAIFKLGPEKRWWQGVPIDPHAVFMITGPEVGK
jgi:murein DD-endopeptidase MepM/ murein hydrolase activator NlpD